VAPWSDEDGDLRGIAARASGRSGGAAAAPVAPPG
jgi:hypothetical protein